MMLRTLLTVALGVGLVACGSGGGGGHGDGSAGPGSFEYLEGSTEGTIRFASATHAYNPFTDTSEVYCPSADGWHLWIWWTGPDPYRAGTILIRVQHPSSETFDSQALTIIMDGEPWIDDPAGLTSGTFSADLLGGSPLRPMIITGGRFRARRI